MWFARQVSQESTRTFLLAQDVAISGMKKAQVSVKSTQPRQQQILESFAQDVSATALAVQPSSCSAPAGGGAVLVVEPIPPLPLPAIVTAPRGWPSHGAYLYSRLRLSSEAAPQRKPAASRLVSSQDFNSKISFSTNRESSIPPSTLCSLPSSRI